MRINQLSVCIMLIVSFPTLFATTVLAQNSKEQNQSDPSPADLTNLGDSLQHMKNAPGRFYELPPRWSGEHNDPEYIQPHKVAENYHYNQTYRPQYHFTALHGHIGDATGLIVYKGQYHLFCMFDPWQRSRGWHKCWGHAISYDLLHWEQLSPVTDTIVDGRSGSGCGIVDWNNSSGLRNGPEKPLLIFYTDYWRGTCIKYSNDGGHTWRYYKHNPVLSGFKDIRDPLVFWYEPDQSWRMVRYEKRGFSFYASKNLVEWQLSSRIADEKYYECPDMFRLPVSGMMNQTKWVLVNGNATYLVGDFNGNEFVPESDLLQVDYGKCLYATQTWKHTRRNTGSVIQMGHMGYNREIMRTWQGQMCFPCKLTLHDSPNGIRLHRQPIVGIENLHKKTQRWLNKTVDSSEFAMGEGDALDIRMVVKPGNATSFGIITRGEEIVWSVSDEQVSCLGHSAPLKSIDGHIQLEILLDRASIEVFGNHGQISMTNRFFPDPDNQKLSFFARKGDVEIIELEVNWLESIWQDFNARP